MAAGDLLTRMPSIVHAALVGLAWLLAASVPSAVRAADVPGAEPAGVASPLAEFLRSALPPPRADAEYVGSESCRSCHPAEHRSWHRTYHRTMTQPAEPGRLLGRFDGTEIDNGGLKYRVSTAEGRHWAEMPDPDVLMLIFQGGRRIPLDQVPRVRLPVVMATGSHHYQTYWVESPRFPGLLQTLPLVYLPQEGQWIPREQAFMRGPDSNDRYITQWNHHCIVCHSTGGVPGLDEAGQLKTRVAELGISCEACHGPGARHVAFQRERDPVPGTPPTRDPSVVDDTIVNPRRLDHDRASQVCGQCHGVFINREESGMEYARKGVLYRPGGDVHATRIYLQHPVPGDPASKWADLRRNPDFFAERWWPDGTILAGGREYTAMRASACFQKGQMSCLDCHSMHDSDPDDQLKPEGQGVAACVACHQEPRYTTEITRHTHHAAGSSGSDCRNCHMPHTTYALFKGIRSHQITSPDAGPSVRSGVPNACNLCHLDRSLGWTSRHLATWYGMEPVSMSAEQEERSALALWLLRGNAAQRVIAAWHAGWEPARQASGGDWLVPLVAQVLGDDYGVVRRVAARSLAQLGTALPGDFDFLGPDEQRAAVAMRLQESFATRVFPGDAEARQQRLLTEEGKPDLSTIRAWWEARDRRSMTIKE